MTILALEDDRAIVLCFSVGAADHPRKFKTYPPPGNPRNSWAVTLIIAGVFLSVAGTCFIHINNELRQIHLQAFCSGNLRSIGAALQNYANANAGLYPDSFEQLAKSAGPEILPSFVCPALRDAPAPTIESLHEGGHQSYLYLGRGKRAATLGKADVLVYESHGNHKDSRSTVLFGDMHVDFVTPVELARALAKVQSAPATQEMERSR